MSGRRRTGGRGGRLLEWGILALALAAGASASAAGITVSVSEFSLTAIPKSDLGLRFTVLNDENASLRVDISPCDWDEDPDGVTRVARPGTVERSCATWLALPEPTHVLRPADEVEVSCDVFVPAGVVGTYWGGLLVAVSPVDAPSEAGGLRVAREFLVKVYVTSPPAAQAAAVTRVAVRGLSPLSVEFSVENRGETRLDDVLGTLSVQETSGATLAETALPRLSILPGHAANVAVEAPWDLIDHGLFLVRVAIDFGGDYLVAGQVVLRVPELSLAPLGTSPNLPRDPNRDGLFEDVDGDGDVDDADVALLAASLDSPVVRGNVRAFDFSNDGRITPADVEALRRRVSWVP